MPFMLMFVPGISAITPYYDDIPLHWQARAMIVFTVFFFCLVTALLYLLRGRLRFDYLFLRAFFTSAAVMWVLFPLSWLGMMSGTFEIPTSPTWHYCFSLVAFLAIYPLSLFAFFRVTNEVTQSA